MNCNSDLKICDIGLNIGEKNHWIKREREREYDIKYTQIKSLQDENKDG